MPNEGAENNPKAEPKEKGDHEKLNKRRFFPTRTVSIYILGGFAAACLVFGPTLLNSHQQPVFTAWLIIFVGLSAGCIVGRLFIINHRTKHPMPGWLDSNWTCGAWILVCFAACAVSAWWAKQPPIPPPLDPLVLSVRSKSKFDLILLTNRSLIVPVIGQPTNMSPAGMLLLPFPERTPEVELRFGVQNTSTPRTVELATITVGMPDWVQSQVSSNQWHHSLREDIRCFSARLPADEPMLGRETWNVYPIRFLTFGTNLMHPFPMTVTVYDKDRPPLGVALWVTIVPMLDSTNPNPQLIMPGN